MTLPVKMFNDIKYELSPKLAAVSALLVGLALLVFLVQALVLLRRRTTALDQTIVAKLHLAGARSCPLPGDAVRLTWAPADARMLAVAGQYELSARSAH